jgi:hypothetical protein
VESYKKHVWLCNVKGFDKNITNYRENAEKNLHILAFVQSQQISPQE